MTGSKTKKNRRPRSRILFVLGLGMLLCWPAAPASSKVYISGNNAVPSPVLQRWLVEIGDCPTDILAARVRDKYRCHGYYDAVVAAVPDADNPNGITLQISEGTPVMLGRIEVDGPPGFDDEPLRLLMRSVFSGIASAEHIEHGLTQAVGMMVDAGFPAVQVSPGDWQREGDRLHFNIRINPGPQVRVGWWKITGLARTDTARVRKALNLHPGMPWTKQERLRLEQHLERLDYLRLTGDVHIIEQANDTLVTVEIPLAERPALIADGGLGIAGGEAAGGGLQGRLDLAFENPFGGGRRLELLVSRPAGKTSQSRLRFNDPHIAGSRVGMFLELEQLRQAAAYDRFSGAVGGSVFLDRMAQAQLEISWSRITPLAGIDDLYPARRYDLSLAAGNRLSFGSAPSSHLGTTWRAGVTGSLRRDFRPTTGGAKRSRSRVRINLGLGRNWRLASRYVMSIAGSVDSWLGPENYLRWGDEIYLGGPATVRGYAERSFKVRGYAVVSTELGYRSTGHFSLFVFSDMAYLRPFAPANPQRSARRIIGYGLGMESSNLLGRTRVELGWPDGGAARDGVIYLRWLRGW